MAASLIAFIVIYFTVFGAGDKLVIASDGTPQWFIADLAAQALGGVTVGIYPTNPWPELQYIVRHCRAKIAVCGDQEQTDKLLDALSHGGGLPDLQQVLTVDLKGMRRYAQPMLHRWADALAEGRELAQDAARCAAFDAGIDALDAAQDALIVYTSGTTGAPKGALNTHLGLLNMCRWQTGDFAMGADCTQTVAANPAFDAIMWEIWPALSVGGTLAFLDAADLSDVTALQSALDRLQPSHFWLPTGLMEAILGDARVRIADEAHPPPVRGRGVPAPRHSHSRRSGRRPRRRPILSIEGDAHATTGFRRRGSPGALRGRHRRRGEEALERQLGLDGGLGERHNRAVYGKPLHFTYPCR